MGRKTHGPYLIAAVEHNDHEKVGEILTQHIRPKEKVKELVYSDVKRLASEHTECPLLLAACLPDPAILVYFVRKHDVNINYVKKIQHGRRTKTKTALIAAVRNGLYDTVEGILGLSAEPNVQDHKGRSALHHAVKKADYRMAKMLLTKGANANLQDMGENSPLHVATIFGHAELVKMLLHYGGDQYKKGQHGAIPIHIAAKEGHVELLKLYCGLQVNPNIKMPCYDGREKAPIHVAAEGGHYQCIELLVEQLGADMNLQDSEGETPLTCCSLNEYDPMGMKSKEDYTECVRILIKSGADINRQNGRGETALHLAARNEFHKIVDVLVQSGADPLLTDNNNDKPIDLVSPEDTVSKQALKQAQEDRERYLNDMLEIQAKGYSTSLKQLPYKSMSSLSIANSINGSQLGYGSLSVSASMPGLNNGHPHMRQEPMVEDNYLEPVSGSASNIYSYLDNSDDSYAAEKNDEKSGSLSSLSKILQQKLSDRKPNDNSSDSSQYGDAKLMNKKRSRSVDIMSSPTASQKKFNMKQNMSQGKGHLPKPPSPPPQRENRESVLTEVSGFTEATSVWDDSVSRTSSVSTFIAQPQKHEERLKHIKQKVMSRGERYVSDTTVYETLPDELVTNNPTSGNLAFKPAGKVQQQQQEQANLSDSDDTFFDDESFDTVSEQFVGQKPQIKPKPQLKSKDLKKKAIANQQKASNKAVKKNPALETWLSEQAEIIKDRKKEGKPPVPIAKPRGPTLAPKAEEESSQVDLTASPSVNHRSSPRIPPKPIPRERGTARKKLIPDESENLQSMEQNNNLKTTQSDDDAVTNDSTFDDMSSEEEGEEEDTPNSGHHAAVLYDSQRQLTILPRTPNRVTTAVEEKKPGLITFQPAPESPKQAVRILQEQSVEDSESESEKSSEEEQETTDSVPPKYATVNKEKQQPTQVAAPVATSVGSLHVSPVVGQVHAVPVVGQVQKISAVTRVQGMNSSNQSNESQEQIYHEIPSRTESPQDNGRQKNVTIGNNVFIPNNVQRPVDFDHRTVVYDSAGKVPFYLVGGNADGVFVHRLELNSQAQKAGLMDGDQLLIINEQKIKGKTKEEVSQLLNSIKSVVKLTVRHKKDKYDRILENNGMGDSFFVKAHFNFAEPRSNELKIHENDIFGVKEPTVQCQSAQTTR